MNSLFEQSAMHTALARAIEHAGGPRFWRQLVLLLRHWVPFDNALGVFYPEAGAPVALEEYDAAPTPGPASSLQYLDGLYLLDPFYQASREGIASGFYRLEEVAPDHFHQTDYYLNYFHHHVLEDEVQYLLQLPGEGTLSLSLGMHERFGAQYLGMLTLCAPWVLALLKQHWAQARPGSAATVTAKEDSRTFVGDALDRFGARVLSERELEVARLILRGYSSKAMAERLGISPETVKVHRRHLYAKLDISAQPELFSLFIQSLEVGDARER
ncbi:helix-turn-helix transcriptional regulator [Pseudomonas japonica]|uniref:helix-turn-helix transcriptional regulator n=1 Tax=Pseudomonas japonica TaxID=256466 RepID=UPI0015E46848|nr:helix-turn-helix transcriptional regulator [Pseudomonas japonica]MBA1242556.1 helix-turn-helix transcriptional regulator [Pseudomonas japonica]